MRGDPDNVIIVDDDDYDDIVICIDDLDTSQQEGKCVICIDDDDESHNVNHSELSAEDDGAFGSYDNPRTTPASNCMPQSEDAGADNCGVGQEKRHAFNLSKCKNTYTNKSPPRNRYGLNSQSESDFESSSSDCEVIEGSSSELREQWKKVRLKKKSNSYDKGSDLLDQVSPCSSQTDTQPSVEVGNGTKQYSEDPVCSRGKTTQPSVEVGNGTKQYSEDPVCSRGKNLHFQEASASYFPATEDDFVGCSFDPWIDGVSTKADNFSHWSEPQSRKNDVGISEQTCIIDCDFPCNECQGVNRCAARFQNGRSDSCGHSPLSIHRSNKKVIGTRSCFQHRKQRTVGEHSFESTVVKSNLDSTKRPCVQDLDEEDSLCEDHFPGAPMEKDLKFSEATSSRNMCSDEEGHDPLNKSMSNRHEGKNTDALSGDVISTVQIDIINEKEKLKETDEYKRVEEEEWAARQLQLNIQAEEAKRLKKRKKAETLRILDMEKRQKRRVEEVRETQRKDEENLNMKEHLRSETRKALYTLESTCTDMASLLRGLGIHVDGGFYPSLQVVNAAYKRAVLKFHPDRASRTDIRQQVEAEEKFKLISRMKEKFSPS
ncbi:uncharacterized protein [Euphorbia lathyris]|uniref:uncharacterized protein n=1 Tax=Euphorbia lathyris TaxID=212925 RepID=UPI0033136186